jgi:hypothetical protein
MFNTAEFKRKEIVDMVAGLKAQAEMVSDDYFDTEDEDGLFGLMARLDIIGGIVARLKIELPAAARLVTEDDVDAIIAEGERAVDQAFYGER